MPFSTEQIRNLVLIGHRGSGKTSLVEGLLFATGAIDRLGKVDNGTATADFEAEEVARQITITPALCHCEHGGVKINLVDTPGYSEFFADVPPAMKVADTALLVLDAQAGVEIHSIKVFNTARDMSVPVVGVISKMDKEHADFAAAVASMNQMLKDCEAVPVQLPIGKGPSFGGVVDLVGMKAYAGEGKDLKAGDVPGEMAEAVAEAREQLIDAVAATDDDLTEKYLEAGELTGAELAAGLKRAVAEGLIVPVMCCDGLSPKGLGAMLEFVKGSCPAPNARPAWTGVKPGSEDEETRPAGAEAPFSAFVFKTLSDPYVGRINLLRVVSGKATSDMAVTNTSRNAKEKLSGLSVMQGKQAQGVPELAAGDLGAVSKLEETRTGDTLSDARQQVVFPLPPAPTPMHSAALTAASRADEDKVGMALPRIAEDDYGLHYERSAETNELIVSGMGALHLDILAERMANRFDVKVNLSDPLIPYRETISKSCRVQGRHKKQTGGRGQFGDVWVRMEPQEPGVEANEFVNEVKGGSVPTNFIPAVEKGVLDGLRKGILAGAPVVGVRVILDDGSSHPVDSSEQAFRMAGSIGVRNALQQSAPILLEPIMNVAITVADGIMGDIMSDMSGRRGQIQGSEPIGGGLQVVRALVPLAEMSRYAADLRSLSQGAASYTMEFSHYQEVPSHLAEGVIAARKAREEAEG
ncbi:MAG: elongation factor G [Armatimonadetes bacterium]|nr:elongation factor G [Armatimonadota bacterium]